jgi:XTP/dITP diphosphohydrolase
MRQLVLASNNPHKIAEIRAILSGVPFEILAGSDFPSFPDPDETGATLEENAQLKAIAVQQATGLWALADDSGLEVAALDGAPGVLSARFAGPQCSFDDNNRKLLSLMRDIPEQERGAKFRAVAALACSDTDVVLFMGEISGVILREPRGEGGFGYDPVFWVPELGCTFAEAKSEAKNRLSHRGRAFRQVAEYLRTA